jgi:predicted lipid-binding transport protein (Tim44 family)
MMGGAQPAYQAAGQSNNTSFSAQQSTGSAGGFSGIGSGAVAASSINVQAIPADFDSDGFVRAAKVHYIRLQAAFDAGNTHDLGEFTSPEMFAELKMDLAEQRHKGIVNEKTEVLSLETQMLAVESSAYEHMASVRFTGMIQEGNAQPVAIDEIWNLTKAVSGDGGWVLAGIQQVQ